MTTNVKTRYTKTGSKKQRKGGKSSLGIEKHHGGKSTKDSRKKLEETHPERAKDLTLSPSLTNDQKKFIPSHYTRNWPYLTKTTRETVLSKVRKGIDLTKDSKWNEANKKLKIKKDGK